MPIQSHQCSVSRLREEDFFFKKKEETRPERRIAQISTLRFTGWACNQQCWCSVSPWRNRGKVRRPGWRRQNRERWRQMSCCGYPRKWDKLITDRAACSGSKLYFWEELMHFWGPEKDQARTPPGLQGEKKLYLQFELQKSDNAWLIWTIQAGSRLKRQKECDETISKGAPCRSHNG